MKRVFVDACVLVPELPRLLTRTAAHAGLIMPLWSVRVIDEWRLAAARRGDDAEDAADALLTAFPDALVGTGELAPEATLPDDNDLHVLASATGAGAEVLLTFNLKDFPARLLSTYDLVPRHPDGFFWELLSGASESFAPSVFNALTMAGLDPAQHRSALKRARLSRFARAYADVAPV